MRTPYQINFFLVALVAPISATPQWIYECGIYTLPGANPFTVQATSALITTPWNGTSITATNIPGPTNTPVATSASGNDMMIVISNMYSTQLSLLFCSNISVPSPVGNPQATLLADASMTQYTFSTGWAGNICVGPNLNINGSKIEGSFTGSPDIDVSYVDDYSVPITCSSEGTAVSDCNIDLFKQSGVTCNQQVDGPVCLNSAWFTPNGSAPPFFAACAGAAYTYPNNNEANVSNLGSNLVSCCIGTSCRAPLQQLPKQENSRKEQVS